MFCSDVWFDYSFKLLQICSCKFVTRSVLCMFQSFSSQVPFDKKSHRLSVIYFDGVGGPTVYNVGSGGGGLRFGYRQDEFGERAF